MTKVMVEALENFPYNYADRKIGDRFECEVDHARVFNAHGKTKPVEEPDPRLPEKLNLPGNKPLPQYETSSVKAEDDEDKDRDSDGRVQGRRKNYKRRDMRAEE